jgi:hypothetical protein
MTCVRQALNDQSAAAIDLLHRELSFWRQDLLPMLPEGRIDATLARAPFRLHIRTDASQFGAGACLLNPVSGEEMGWGTVFPDEITAIQNISAKEIAVMGVALEYWAPLLTEADVTVWCDNMATVHTLRRLAARSSLLMGLAAHRIAYLLLQSNTDLTVKWIASADNVTADALSRGLTPLNPLFHYLPPPPQAVWL